MIVSSFRSQYGIRLSREASDMTWDEFTDLLAGLDPETPLGRMVRIRTEDDEKVLEHYTPEMRKIRSDWQKRIAAERSETEVESFLDSMKEMFKRMAGEK